MASNSAQKLYDRYPAENNTNQETVSNPPNTQQGDYLYLMMLESPIFWSIVTFGTSFILLYVFNPPIVQKVEKTTYTTVVDRDYHAIMVWSLLASVLVLVVPLLHTFVAK